MLRRFARLPLTQRIPIAAAAMIFVVAVGTTQLALRTSSRQLEQQLERIGQVYLDGITAALQPAAQRGDREAMKDVLTRALTVHVGIEDRRLLVLDGDGQVVVQAFRPGSDQAQPLPAIQAGPARPGLQFQGDERGLWVWRPFDRTALPSAAEGGTIGTVAATVAPQWTVVALLDVGEFVGERERLRWLLLAIDLAISAAGALLGYLVARRLQDPLARMTEHLRRTETQGPHPMDLGLLPAGDPELDQLARAINRMATDAGEREALLSRLVEQEREAGLGRLAATLAHEIRNPLGGLAATVQTLRRFGDQPAVRDEALAFMDRGVRALQELTDAMLRTHRPGTAGRALTPDDLADLVRMARADGERRGVTVRLEADLPPTIPVAATEVRQTMLNLLLNAVRATGPGGEVRLAARIDAGTLSLEVRDQGPGLAPAVVRDLADRDHSDRGRGGRVPSGAGATHGGLGVTIVVRLVERLRGRLSVESGSDGGTRIAVHLPLEPASFPDGAIR